ncbi:Cationic peroxidase SPC4 [Acorus gramineus]|uniref:Peroxidase n=1 Tax=Acorus gramineus TaxID=55184 RepID=A0AAV9AHH1_ACOGR|nr:Cationic peroxidase SPC4 [Acorus gramineus]
MRCLFLLSPSYFHCPDRQRLISESDATHLPHPPPPLIKRPSPTIHFTSKNTPASLMASITSSLFLFSSTLLFLLISFPCSDAQTAPPLVKGLSYTFYKSTCPNLESIIRTQLQTAFKSNIGLAAALLRVHFHDCFVQGCDGSVLLDGSASGPSEKSAPPNLTLRKAAFDAINSLRNAIEKACGRVVSCADIAALAARDSVALSGGPNYKVPLGRRDGATFATVNDTLKFLPSPRSNVSVLLSALALNNLDVNDLVALSGGHTIGIGHCTSFENRLFPGRDPTMDQTFFKNLRLTCPVLNTTNTTNLDLRTPNIFDNKYYVDLMNRQGLFTSDQDMYIDSRTKPIVLGFAVNQSLFYEKFAFSMVKMGMLKVLTGTSGQIRANCSAKNPGTVGDAWSVVDLDVGSGGGAAAY